MSKAESCTHPGRRVVNFVCLRDKGHGVTLLLSPSPPPSTAATAVDAEPVTTSSSQLVLLFAYADSPLFC